MSSYGSTLNCLCPFSMHSLEHWINWTWTWTWTSECILRAGILTQAYFIKYNGVQLPKTAEAGFWVRKLEFCSNLSSKVCIYGSSRVIFQVTTKKLDSKLNIWVGFLVLNLWFWWNQSRVMFKLIKSSSCITREKLFGSRLRNLPPVNLNCKQLWMSYFLICGINLELGTVTAILESFPFKKKSFCLF